MKLRPPGDDGTSESHAAPAPAGAVREVAYTSSDGLTLAARDHGDRSSPWLPVVCLPGLSRTARDFDAIATYFATDRQRPRRVVAFDYRGRGRSAWAASAEGYNPVTEMTDVLDGMAALGLARAVVVGMSRGGIIGMMIGVARPHVVAALVLNDVGPAIEARGLARIRSYVGRTPVPDDWEDAARIQRRLHAAQFTAWGDDDWRRFARLTYRDDNGRPAADYDPALARTLETIDFDGPMPSLWNEFRAMKTTPILVLRGENSDILSSDTVAAMVESRPDLAVMTVAGEGHAPMLRPGPIADRIGGFIAEIEGDAPPPEAVAPRHTEPIDLDAPATDADRR